MALLRATAIVAVLNVAFAAQFVFNTDKCSNNYGVPLGATGSGWRLNDPIVENINGPEDVPASVSFTLPPGETDSYRSTNTLMSSGKYDAGEFVFAFNGEYTFENNVEFEFHHEATGPAGYFVGGQPSDSNIAEGNCDITCADNLFKVQTTYDPSRSLESQVQLGILAPAKVSGELPTVTCNKDELIIPAAVTSLQANGHLMTFGSLTTYDTQLVPTSYSDPENVPQNLFYDISGESEPTAQQLFFGTAGLAVCQERNLVSMDDDTECLCLTTCASDPAELLEINRVIEEAAAAAAAEELRRETEEATVTFHLEMVTEPLGITLDSLQCYFEELFVGTVNSTILADYTKSLETALADNWGPDAVVVEITSLVFDHTASPYPVEFVVSITSVAASFKFLDANGALVDIPRTQAGSGLSIDSPSKLNNKIAEIAVEHLVSVTEACVIEAELCSESQVDSVVSACGSACLPGGLGYALFTNSQPADMVSNFNALVSGAIQLGGSLSLVDDAMLNDVDFLDLFVAYNASFTRDDTALTTYLERSARCPGVVEQALMVREMLLPVKMELTLPDVVVGQHFNKLKTLQIDNSLNSDAFKTAIRSALEGFPPFTVVGAVEFEKVAKDGSRRAVDLSDFAGTSEENIVLSINYTTSVPSTCDLDATVQVTGCPIVDASPAYDAVATFLDNVAVNYTIVDPPCKNASQTTDCPIGFNKECIDDLGNDLLDAQGSGFSAAQQRELLTGYIFSITRCGPLGEIGGGDCLDEDAISLAQNCASEQAGAIAAAANPSSSSGFPIIVVIAAAVGVLLIVLIILIVVKLRQRNNPARKTTNKDRTVVSFENPIYDDPGTDAYAGSPVYEAGDDGEDEGLYDEPAFNADKKQTENPLYDSNESLAAYSDEEEEEEDDGGYLDVDNDE